MRTTERRLRSTAAQSITSVSLAGSATSLPSKLGLEGLIQVVFLTVLKLWGSLRVAQGRSFLSSAVQLLWDLTTFGLREMTQPGHQMLFVGNRPGKSQRASLLALQCPRFLQQNQLLLLSVWSTHLLLWSLQSLLAQQSITNLLCRQLST